MPTVDRWLLPEGIEEILPPQAAKLESLRRELLDLYISWGYLQVFPPLVEYLESLLTGTGNDLNLQTFKLTDQLTGRMMGVRADMTPQVARIDAHTMPDGPVRLCYVGDVLHTRAESMLESRGQIQLGVELFGHPGIDADLEVIALMLQTLQRAGLEKLSLDLGHVGIYRELVKQAGFKTFQKQELKAIYQRKAVPELQTFLDDNLVEKSTELKQAFLSLVELAGASDILGEARSRFQAFPAVMASIDDLQTLAERIKQQFPGVELYFDLSELRGYHYHTGAIYSVYVEGVGQEIANGGRYDHVGEVFGRARPATGFSTNLAALIKYSSAEPYADNPLIYAPNSQKLNAEVAASLAQVVADFRQQGRRVMMALEGQSASPQQLGCGQQLVYEEGCWQLQAVSSEQ